MSRQRRGRHEGAIFKRKDGRWEARRDIGIAEDGKRIRKSFYGKTKQEVLQKLADKSLIAIPSADGPNQSLSEYLNSWLEQSRLNVAHNTYDLRRRTITNHINPLIGGRTLRSLGVSHVVTLLMALRDRGRRAADTANRIFNAEYGLKCGGKDRHP